MSNIIVYSLDRPSHALLSFHISPIAPNSWVYILLEWSGKIRTLKAPGTFRLVLHKPEASLKRGS